MWISCCWKVVRNMGTEEVVVRGMYGLPEAVLANWYVGDEEAILEDE